MYLQVRGEVGGIGYVLIVCFMHIFVGFHFI